MLKPDMRRSSDPTARAGLGASFALLAVVVAVELADGPRANLLGLLAAAPFLAAAFASWRDVCAVGGVASCRMHCLRSANGAALCKASPRWRKRASS